MTPAQSDATVGINTSDIDLLVVGLGYVGLPLAQAATLAGLKVAGLDISKATVEGLGAGRSHIDDLSDADLEEMQARGFAATDDPAIISRARAITICVPTPLRDGRAPDLAAVRSATSMIAAHLAPGALVVLESTTYPGTTDEVLLPMFATEGREVGRDFFLAFSPERVDPGNPTYGITNTPKIVGGVTPDCTGRAAQLYARFVDEVVLAKGTREAEMSKLLENTYRHVNIALINELAQFSHELKIDIWDVIRCAATKPFGFQAFYPGPGVGGHCIPIDPNYLSYRVESSLGAAFRFVDLAGEINASMPAYVVRRAQDLLNESSKAVKDANVLLIGVAYKANVSDTRETPATEVARRLIALGARVTYHDPLVDRWVQASPTSASTLRNALAAADLAIVLQLHDGVSADEVGSAPCPVLDTRGVVSGANTRHL